MEPPFYQSTWTSPYPSSWNWRIWLGYGNPMMWKISSPQKSGRRPISSTRQPMSLPTTLGTTRGTRLRCTPTRRSTSSTRIPIKVTSRSIRLWLWMERWRVSYTRLVMIIYSNRNLVHLTTIQWRRKSLEFNSYLNSYRYLTYQI